MKSNVNVLIKPAKLTRALSIIIAVAIIPSLASPFSWLP